MACSHLFLATPRNDKQMQEHPESFLACSTPISRPAEASLFEMMKFGWICWSLVTGKSHSLEINLDRVNVRLQMETVCKELTPLVDISLELCVILGTHVYAIL